MRVSSSPSKKARVPSSPSKSRIPSPSGGRPYLRPLLLANRARTTLPRPPFTLTKQRARITSPRRYKMTKSVHAPTRERDDRELVIPEITVTPPAPTPALWAEGASAAVEFAGKFPDPPVRTSSRGAKTTPSENFNPFESTIPPASEPCNTQPYDDGFLLAPPEKTGHSDSSASATVAGPAVTTTHCVPLPDHIPLPPHGLRRVGSTWDFMPNCPFPGAGMPLDNPSRQRILRRGNTDTIGRAL